MSCLLSHANFKDFISKLFQLRKIGIYKFTCVTFCHPLSVHVSHILNTLVPHVSRALNALLLHVYQTFRVFVTHAFSTPGVVMLLASLAPLLSCALYIPCANIMFFALCSGVSDTFFYINFLPKIFFFWNLLPLRQIMHIGNYLMWRSA